MSEEQIQALLDKHASELGEHFESVQIIVTTHEGSEGISGMASSGAGSFHARLGAVREWSIAQDQYVRTRADKEQRDSYDQDGNA